MVCSVIQLMDMCDLLFLVRGHLATGCLNGDIDYGLESARYGTDG